MQTERVATLRSNSGSHSISLERTHDGVSVRISGSRWDGDHEHPLLLETEGLCIRDDELSRLREALKNWLALPLSELAATPLEGEFLLADEPGELLTLRFGSRDDVISERKPVASIVFEFGLLIGEYHIATDQSCVQLFLDELPAVFPPRRRGLRPSS